MSNSAKLPAHPSLEQLQKQAKELFKRERAGAPREKLTLAAAQFQTAAEYGFESWAKLKRYVEALPVLRVEEYERLAQDLADAHMTDNPSAVRQVNRTYGTTFVADFHDVSMMQKRLTTWFAAETKTADLALADARQMVAHSYGFQNWESFMGSAPALISSATPFYEIDREENRLTARGPLSEKDWKAIFAVIKERGITALKADGITDKAFKQLARLERVTSLTANSNKLTDEGLKHLAQMPQLVELDLSGPNIGDGGLEALRQLTVLRRFQSCWTPGISDAGTAHLAACDLLESVNLLGTATGDGLIRSLAGKPKLRKLKTGRGMTDAGIKLLHQIPAFKTWQSEEAKYGVMTFEAEPNHLLIDGPFTDSGLAGLAGLDGLFGLTFFWHSQEFTSAGFRSLRMLPRLGFLGCQDERCDDAAMREIAALPHLRMLMGQGAVATDEGWEALSRSPNIEYIWGRDCSGLTGRGFAALAQMPALRGLAVSCKNVDDGALALLPKFPALRELVPMDVTDAGFRHMGECGNLEQLWCMYCRDTGDAATEQIRGLRHLKTYYAGMTQITDRSLEILGRMAPLERIEFWACPRITDLGIGRLVDLPELRDITISGSPLVGREVAALFPKRVRVKYTA